MVSLLSGRASLTVKVTLLPLRTFVELALIVALFLASETRATEVLRPLLTPLLPDHTGDPDVPGGGRVERRTGGVPDQSTVGRRRG